MPTTENTKGFHPGISVWIRDEENDLIIPADIVEELQDGFWKCACPWYSDLPMADPDLYMYARHESEIFRTRDEILDYMAAQYRKTVSWRSYERQLDQERRMEKYDDNHIIIRKEENTDECNPEHS